MQGFQILGIAFGTLLAAVVLFFSRAGLLREKYSLLWLIMSAFIIFVSLFRNILEGIAGLAGIEYAPSALFAILIGALFILLLNSAVSVSHIKKNNKNLIQRVGLMKLQIDDLERKLKNHKEGAL